MILRLLKMRISVYGQRTYLATQAATKSRRKAQEMTKLAKERATNYLWGWNGRENSSLHPLLSQLFSRTALLELWKPELHTTNPGEKRKRDDDGELEYGMGGFGGDTGGFGDAIDYSVQFSQDLLSDDRKWKLVVMQKK